MEEEEEEEIPSSKREEDDRARVYSQTNKSGGAILSVATNTGVKQGWVTNELNKQ